MSIASGLLSRINESKEGNGQREITSSEAIDTGLLPWFSIIAESIESLPKINWRRACIPKTKEYYQVASTIVEPSNLSENQVEEFENWLYNSDYTEELINNIDLIVEDRKEEWEKFLSVLGENGY